MSRRSEPKPLGVAAGIALVALWFHVGLAALEVLSGGFTPDPNLRFLSGVAGLAYTAVAIGVQRRRPAAAVWGVALSALSCGIALGNRDTVLSSQLLVLIPLIIVATRPREPEHRTPRKPRPGRGERPQAVWFPGPMDDPVLARLRMPRDWD